MVEANDPPRLRDPESQVPSELSTLFHGAGLELPSAARLEAIRARLPGSPAPGVTPLPHSGKWPLFAKVVAGTALLGVAALLIARARSAPPLVVSTPATSSTLSASATAPASIAPEAPPTPARATEVPSAPAASGSVAALSSRPGAAAKKPNEALLLERARSALTTDPARSLALVRRHRAEFPNGVLQQEREVIGIEALRRLGRSDEAARRAQEFRREFPDSAHGRAVEKGHAR